MNGPLSGPLSGPLNPESMIRQIQSGDEALREQLIERSIPFVKRVVRQVTHIWFVEQADEFSIALDAFNQAISRYDTTGDVPFEPYARLLIRNRLFDWMRCQRSHRLETTMTDCEREDGSSPADQVADPDSVTVQQDLEFAEAMTRLEGRLQRFNLSLPRLTAAFPKHQDSRLLCIRIAKALSSDETLYVHLAKTGRLPGAELSRRCQVPVKTIEKNRSSIILLTLLLQSDLDVIKSYIRTFEREESR